MQEGGGGIGDGKRGVLDDIRRAKEKVMTRVERRASLNIDPIILVEIKRSRCQGVQER